jgi:hypothetical protein
VVSETFSTSLANYSSGNAFFPDGADHETVENVVCRRCTELFPFCHERTGCAEVGDKAPDFSLQGRWAVNL